MVKMKTVVPVSREVAQQLGIWREGLDFQFTIPDEPLVLSFTCDGEKWNGKCGCKRSLSGILSAKATTIFTIKTQDINLKKLTKTEFAKGWKYSEDDLFRLIDATVQNMEEGFAYQYVGDETLKRTPLPK